MPAASCARLAKVDARAWPRSMRALGQGGCALWWRGGRPGIGGALALARAVRRGGEPAVGMDRLRVFAVEYGGLGGRHIS